MVLLGSWVAVVAVGEGVVVEDVAVVDEEEVLLPIFGHHYYYEPVEVPEG